MESINIHWGNCPTFTDNAPVSVDFSTPEEAVAYLEGAQDVANAYPNTVTPDSKSEARRSRQARIAYRTAVKHGTGFKDFVLL